MKYLIFTLLILAGCGAQQPVKKDTKIHLDQNILTDENTRAGWLAYGLAMSAWEPELLENGEPDLFAREIYARNTSAQIWKEMKANGSADPGTDLDILQYISESGFMAEYLWVYLRDSKWQKPDNLRLEEFSKWQLINLEGHIPVKNTGVSVR